MDRQDDVSRPIDRSPDGHVQRHAGMAESAPAMKAIAIALAVGLALGGLAAGKVQQWRYQTVISDMKTQQAREAEKAAEDAARKLQATLDELTEAQDRIAALDKELYEERENAKKQQRDYEFRLGSGTVRVFAPATCPADSAAAGVDHAAGRAELDPAFAASVAGITGDGDDAIRQLNACQAYIRELQVQFGR